MAMQQCSRAVAVTLVIMQILGPGMIWAMDQRGVEVRRATGAIVSGLAGGELTATSPEGTKTVQFNEAVGFGDQLRTQSSATADVLINNQAVVTMLGDSDASVTEVNGDTVVHLSKGSVLVSAAASALGESQSVIIETPATHITMKGGMLKATVGTAPRQASIIQSSANPRAYLVSLTSMRPVALEPATTEHFEIYEGQAQVGVRTAGATPLVVEPGQSVEMVGGTLGSPSALERPSAGTERLLLATAQHAATPQTGLDLVSQRQMQQVGALQQALFGDPDAQIEGKESQSGTIISALFGTKPTSNNPDNPTASLFGSGSPYFAALLAAISRSGSGVSDDKNDDVDSLKVGRIEEITVNGGPGLLLFTKAKFNILDHVSDMFVPDDPKNPLSDGMTVPIHKTREEFHETNIRAVSELLRVEGGEPSKTTPHLGLPPKETLIVRGLSERYLGIGSAQEIADNLALPLQYSGSGEPSPSPSAGPLRFPLTRMLSFDDLKLVPQNAVIAMRGLSEPVPGKEDPHRFFDTLQPPALTGLGVFSSEPDGAIAFDPTGNRGTGGDVQSFVDASITARSPLTGDRFVTLSGGVVLDQGSIITIGKTDATEKAFQKFGGAFNGSVLALLADDKGNSAFVQIRDRALGVVDGSAILGSGNLIDVALLSVLDSRLIGPTETPSSRNKEGVLKSHREMNEIPPLLELSAVDPNGKASGPVSAVFVKSAVVVRSSGISFGALDGALLEASSPILTLANSQMNAGGHVIDLAGRGPNGKDLFNVSVIPGDALVRLDRGSSLTVSGNLLNLANGASATVNGYLFSISSGSTLTLLNGTLLSLTGNSVFRLTSNAFGVFGVFGEGGKPNTLELHNNLCAGGECGMLTDHSGAQFKLSNGKPIQVSGVGRNNVKVPQGFTPFQSPNGIEPTLKIGEHAALLHIEPGSELHIEVPVNR